MNKQCCNTPTKAGRKNNEFAVWCEICGKKGKGKTENSAMNAFDKSKPTNPNPAPPPANLPAIITRPTNSGQLATWASQHGGQLTALVSPAVDRPKMKTLIAKNVRYIQNATQLSKAWTTDQGQDSIIAAYEDALILGAELGQMGDIVPFGDICEFIPAIEAYEFALTNGNGAPFKNITIEPIYSGDIAPVGRKDGNFFVNFEKMGNPRGEVVQVAVYGYNHKAEAVIGELYDAERLLQKAEQHSKPYRYYLQDLRSFESLRGEGKTGFMNGREYFEKEIPKAGGGTWKKKVFIDELSNPYAGADQPEMLRKAAGKSFLRKYARVRNSEAAMGEMAGAEEKDLDDIAEEVLSQAMNQFDDVGDPAGNNAGNVADIDYEVVDDVVSDETEHTPDGPDKQPELNIH